MNKFLINIFNSLFQACDIFDYSYLEQMILQYPYCQDLTRKDEEMSRNE
jgi:hypothetical protein